jgi:hypothetical protein
MPSLATPTKKASTLLRMFLSSYFVVLTADAFLSINETRLYRDGLVQINPVASFETVGLHPAMLKNVQLSSYDISTPM